MIYGRQSKTRDGSESLDLQLAECRRAAAQHDVDVVAEVLEPPSTSAFKNRGRGRPRFPEVLELVRAGAVEVVVGYKSDRFSRGGGPGWAPMFDAAEAAGLDLDRLVLTPGGFLSEFEIGIRATMDREESKKISDRMADMKEAHAAKGAPGGGGHRAYGYKRDGVTVIDAEAAVMRELVDRYLAGEGFRQLARWLNDEGHPTSTGGAWRDGTVRNMLVNPRYAALRTHHGDVVGDAAWPAIIDRATWERLQARLRSRATGLPSSSPWRYLLTHVLVCGHCGGRLYGAPVQGRARYRCQKGPGRVNCGRITIAAAPVDERVVEMVLYRLESPAVVDGLAGRTGGADDELAASTTEIVELEARQAELAAAFADGEIGRKEWVLARRRIEDKLTAERGRLARHERTAAVTAALDEPDLRARWADLALGRQQAIIGALIDRIVVAPAATRGSKHVDLDRLQVHWRA